MIEDLSFDISAKFPNFTSTEMSCVFVVFDFVQVLSFSDHADRDQRKAPAGVDVHPTLMYLWLLQKISGMGTSSARRPCIQRLFNGSGEIHRPPRATGALSVCFAWLWCSMVTAKRDQLIFLPILFSP